MKSVLIGIGATLLVVAAVVFAIINFAVSRSADVYNASLDPAEMKSNYETMHSECSGVRTLWQQWQDDTKAVTDYQSQNASLLNNTSNGVAVMQAHQELSVLQTVAQGDRDQLATTAGQYDNLVETKTKNIGSKWVQIIFFDTGLPQSITPPYTDVNCGSGVWPSQAAA